MGQAGIKLAKQVAEIMPNVIKMGGDGMNGGDILKGVGFPAVEGWYCTIASPHVSEDPAMAKWVEDYTKKFNVTPSDYAVTAYDAALVIIDAVQRVAASGKEVNKANIRDAIQSAKVKTLQGEVAFDENGDIVSRVISVFEIKHDPKYPDDDVIHQYKYIGVAPQTPAS